MPTPSPNKTEEAEQKGVAKGVRALVGAQTPILVTEGTWSGHLIRRARKSGRCAYWHGLAIGRCKARIEPGDLYMEGEMSDDAGGYACERYCIACAGTGAALALSLALGESK